MFEFIKRLLTSNDTASIRAERSSIQCGRLEITSDGMSPNSTIVKIDGSQIDYIKRIVIDIDSDKSDIMVSMDIVMLQLKEMDNKGPLYDGQ